MKVAKSASGLLVLAILVLSGCHEFGRDRDWDRGRPGDYSGRPGRMERAEGTVTIVDRGHGTFEMGLRDSSKIVFFVGSAGPEAKNRFASLKVGDYVRAEGRPRAEPNQFDLESLR